MESELEKLKREFELLREEHDQTNQKYLAFAQNTASAEEQYKKIIYNCELQIKSEREAAALLNKQKDDLIKLYPMNLLTGSYSGTALDVSMRQSQLAAMNIKSSGLVFKMREAKYMCTPPLPNTYDELEANRMKFPLIPDVMTTASMLDYAAAIAFNVRQGSKKTISNTNFKNIDILKSRYIQYDMQENISNEDLVALIWQAEIKDRNDENSSTLIEMLENSKLKNIPGAEIDEITGAWGGDPLSFPV